MSRATVGEVASINPPSPKIPADQEVSFVGMANLDAEAATASPLETRNFQAVSTGYTIFQDGDILAAKITPCWENGKVGQAQLAHPVGVGSTEFHVLRPGKHLDARYLMYFLRQPQIRSAGELRMTGSGGQRRVPAAFLHQLELPLPPLPEQRRIAAILDHADALRAKRRQVIGHLDSLPQSVFQSAFRDVPLDSTLGQISQIQGGLQVSARRRDLPCEVPYLRVANVHRGRLDLTEVKTLRANPAEIQRTTLQRDDLLLVEGHANSFEVGRVARWEGAVELCVHQNHLIRGRINRSLADPVFISAWLNSARGAAHFRRAAKTTSGLNTISTATVRSAPVPLPPLAAQARFASHVEAVSRRQATARQALDAAELLFASLQSRAFHGEL